MARARAAGIEITNPPTADMVDDLVAAAMILRTAGSDRQQPALGRLYAQAAARLEADAAALRDPSQPIAPPPTVAEREDPPDVCQMRAALACVGLDVAEMAADRVRELYRRLQPAIEAAA
jgi:hypothetical protein